MLIAVVEKTDSDPAGSTWTMREFIDQITAAGHQVAVITLDKPKAGKYMGLPVTWQFYADKILKQASLIIAPHWPTGPQVRTINKLYQKPIVFVAHHAEKMGFLREKQTYPEAVICMNSAQRDLIREKAPHVRAIMYHPVIQVAKYKVREPASAPAASEEAEAAAAASETADLPIGFVNCNFVKGAHMFYEVAAANPDRKFLVVKGYYMTHIHKPLPNVEFVEYGDIRPFYQRIRLLLAPSRSDSWSRVANEAMCSGIPVLYSSPRPGEDAFVLTTEGLEECVGSGGMGLPDRAEAWTAAIASLDDPTAYAAASAAARARADVLEKDTEGQLMSLVDSIAIKAPVLPVSGAPPRGPPPAGVHMRPGGIAMGMAPRPGLVMAPPRPGLAPPAARPAGPLPLPPGAVPARAFLGGGGPPRPGPAPPRGFVIRR